jgi:F0F1-type ATP synthase membrane subunit b/b'
MKDIVEQVLREEEQARSSLEKARAQAQRLIDDAKKEAERQLTESDAQNESDSVARIAETQKDFLAEKEHALISVKEQSQTLRLARQQDIPDIARAVFQQIIALED